MTEQNYAVTDSGRIAYTCTTYNEAIYCYRKVCSSYDLCHDLIEKEIKNESFSHFNKGIQIQAL